MDSESETAARYRLTYAVNAVNSAGFSTGWIFEVVEEELLRLDEIYWQGGDE